MTKEIPYANLMEKLGITWKQVEEIVQKLGWDEVPNCHRVIRKPRRGRQIGTKATLFFNRV